MNKRAAKALKQIGVLLFTAALFWFAFRNIATEDGVSKTDFIINAWQGSSKTLLVLSGLVALLSHVIRAERWKLLLKPIGYPLKSSHSFLSVMVGYFVNLAIPRGGELSRCYNLYKLNRTPIDISFGSVLSERIIDLILLLIFIGIVFLGEYDLLVQFFQHIPIDFSKVNAYKIIAVVLLVSLPLFLGLRLLHRRSKLPFSNKLSQVLVGLKSGVLSIMKLEKSGLFFFYSIAIWGCYYWMNYLVMQAFPATAELDLIAALTIFIIGGIALAIPLPGGAGSYHTLVPLGLTLIYGVNKPDAIAFAVIVHAWQTLIIIFAGAISLLISQLFTKASTHVVSSEDTIQDTTQNSN